MIFTSVLSGVAIVGVIPATLGLKESLFVCKKVFSFLQQLVFL